MSEESAEPFSKKDLEEIVARAIEYNESRKQEFLRWTGATLLGLAILGTLILEKLEGYNWTSQGFFRVLLIGSMALVAAKAAWTAMDPRIDDALRRIVSRPKKHLDYSEIRRQLREQPRFSVRRFLPQNPGLNVLLTASILGLHLIVEEPTAKRLLLLLAGFRLLALSLTVVSAVVLKFASTPPKSPAKVPENPFEDRLATTLAALISELDRRSHSVGVLIASSYYGPQMLIMAVALVAVGGAGVPELQIFLYSTVACGLLFWITRVTWKTVGRYSGTVERLQNFHNALVLVP